MLNPRTPNLTLPADPVRLLLELGFVEATCFKGYEALQYPVRIRILTNEEVQHDAWVPKVHLDAPFVLRYARVDETSYIHCETLQDVSNRIYFELRRDGWEPDNILRKRRLQALLA